MSETNNSWKERLENILDMTRFPIAAQLRYKM